MEEGRPSVGCTVSVAGTYIRHFAPPPFTPTRGCQSRFLLNRAFALTLSRSLSSNWDPCPYQSRGTRLVLQINPELFHSCLLFGLIASRGTLLGAGPVTRAGETFGPTIGGALAMDCRSLESTSLFAYVDRARAVLLILGSLLQKEERAWERKQITFTESAASSSSSQNASWEKLVRVQRAPPP